MCDDERVALAAVAQCERLLAEARDMAERAWQLEGEVYAASIDLGAIGEKMVRDAEASSAWAEANLKKVAEWDAELRATYPHLFGD